MAKVSSQSSGSWFPSGYYGHYRSRVRTDFVNEYRQLSKPQPPRRFIHRSSQPSATHQFSIHDNRNSFMTDASYFAQGLGKKRHPDRSASFDPDFVAWTPHKINRNSGRPLTSTYRQDFPEDANVQKLIKRPKTSFDGVPTTTYRTVHGADSPNRDFINAMNNESLMLTSLMRQRQAKTRKLKERETVASCMSWYRPRICGLAATDHTDFNHIDMRPVNTTDLHQSSCGSGGETSAISESAPTSEPIAATSE